MPNFNMEKEEMVGIGKRVEALFQPVEEGFKLLQWRVIDEPDRGFTGPTKCRVPDPTGGVLTGGGSEHHQRRRIGLGPGDFCP